MFRTKIFLLILILFFLQSCKNEKNNDLTPSINTNGQFKTIISKSTFEEKLEKEPKLFLKFWSGMTKNEFEKVVNILNEEKILMGKYYSNYSPIRFLVGENCSSDMKARFDFSKEPKLVSIKLYNLAEYNCLYDLYKEKYGLPNLLKKAETDYEYVENNPNYSPVMSYTNDNKKLIFLNNAFNDKSSFIKNNDRIEKKTFLPSRTTYILPESPITIYKDSLVIVIDQVKHERKSYSYSLNQSQAFLNYQSSIYNDPTNRWLNEAKFIETNSKLRTVSLKSFYSINATYMSVTEYNKEKQERNNQIKDSLETVKRNKEKLLKSIESL